MVARLAVFVHVADKATPRLNDVALITELVRPLFAPIKVFLSCFSKV